MSSSDNFPTITLEDIMGNSSLSQKQKALVCRMGCGGESNRKGATYETHFAAQLILEHSEEAVRTCSLGVSTSLSRVMLTNSMLGAVDDWCVMVNDGDGLIRKLNYQLKNSANTGKWGEPLESRFAIQDAIDSALPRTNFRHTLVCSDKEAVEGNQSQLLGLGFHLRWECRYFPYFESLTDRVMGDKTFRSLLSKFVSSNSNLDAAARILCSEFSTDTSVRKNLWEIWQDVRRMAHPDIFVPFPDTGYPLFPALPVEFTEKCETFGIRIEENHVLYQGMKLRFSDNLSAEIFREGVTHLNTPEDVIDLVMRVSSVRQEESIQ